jgi:3',5'-cyclic AMP phosphodiesterase CpdA
VTEPARTRTVVHLSDLHFGVEADLAQLAELERVVPAFGADAIAVSGDLTQRARHGEFVAARRFLDAPPADGALALLAP